MTQIRGEQTRSAIIPQVSSDPTTPATGQMWVLKTGAIGQPIGLLLSLTYASPIYQVSYKTDTLVLRTLLG